jgi:hypothetical protein
MFIFDFSRLHGMISQKLQLFRVYIMGKTWNVDTLCCAQMTMYGPLNVFISESVPSFQINWPILYSCQTLENKQISILLCLKPAIINFIVAKITVQSRPTITGCSVNYSKKQPLFVITSDITSNSLLVQMNLMCVPTYTY